MSAAVLPPRRFSFASRLILALLSLLVFVVAATFFTVDEGQTAIVTRFGRPVREILSAGPYWKWPAPVEQLHRIDQRRRVFQTPNATSFTHDKKNIVLSTYVVWHIERPLEFLQSVGSPETAEANLTAMVLAAKTQRIGKHDLTALISTQAKDSRIEQVEREIASDVTAEALTRMGVAIDQVGIERIAFPPENLAAVFERMRSERQSEANRIRTEAAKVAQGIRDQTHIESQEILRKGREQASTITADAERQATELLAKAHQLNPDFYRFWSSLQASKRILKERSTLVTTTDQLQLDALTSPPSRELLQPPPPQDRRPRLPSFNTELQPEAVSP